LLRPCWWWRAGGNRARALAARGLEQVALAAGIETEVADFLEAVGQDVLHESAQKLDWMQGLGLAILGAEGDRVTLNLNEAAVGDRDTVGVATEVAEEVLSATKRPLGIDTSAQMCEPRHQSLEGQWILESIEALKLSVRLHVTQKVQHLAAENLSQCSHGKQVFAAG